MKLSSSWRRGFDSFLMESSWWWKSWWQLKVAGHGLEPRAKFSGSSSSPLAQSPWVYASSYGCSGHHGSWGALEQSGLGWHSTCRYYTARSAEVEPPRTWLKVR